VNRLRTVLAITACAALLVTGCTKVVDGKPITVAANPTEIAGKPVTEGPSGLRPNAPGPKRPVVNGDGGPIDNLAATSIDDIEQFWTEQYRAPFKGKFIPVDALFSWDSTSKENGVFCDETTTDIPTPPSALSMGIAARRPTRLHVPGRTTPSDGTAEFIWPTGKAHMATWVSP
jgi:hypothetical protein